MLPPRKPSNKLTLDDAIQILKMLKQGYIQSRIAAFYEVNQARISEIKNKRKFPEAHKYVKD
ncbi:hypothetical protein [Maritalea mediterranea]|uniref:Helix-turn-helix domain-containing protein n=1 Tax=Maritalea mediterranea TaxID=2909667 RepID=A0ABS9EA73_9HYPH|nr:hypothetical protein [Maritalea mediterranea]MCF4099097.1 hypothetical protein [Maritalea mediterranea]